MNIRAKFFLLLTAILSMVSYSVTAADIFSDSFESGDLLKSNPDGFKWTDMSWVSLITETHEVWWNYQADHTPKSTAHGFPGGNWIPKTGTHSMRLRYAAGQKMSEQRFDLGKPYRSIWISYWLRVPINFKHRSTSPTNHKLFSLWMDDYSSKGDGPTIAWEFWNDGNGGSQLTVHYSPGNYTTANAHKLSKQFITYPTDQGRWMHIVLHVAAATDRNSNDGVIQLWRNWQGKSSYTKIHELLDADIASPPGGQDGWQRGYLMGWANAPYQNDTEWLLDDFTVSDQSLLNTKFPKPPVLDSVQN